MAVKVIDHRVKGNGNAVDIQRETILSTSVVHPNVVSVSGFSGAPRSVLTRMLQTGRLVVHALCIPQLLISDSHLT